MSIKEQEFMRELKALLDKHKVGFAKDVVYYDGESENPRFVFPDDKKSYSYITIDDMADLRGGWRY